MHDRQRLLKRVLDSAIAVVDSSRHGALSSVSMVWRPDICRRGAPYIKSDRVRDRNYSRIYTPDQELHPFHQ